MVKVYTKLSYHWKWGTRCTTCNFWYSAKIHKSRWCD